MIDANAPPLTAKQERQLAALLKARAKGEAHGISIYDLLEHGTANPLVLGALRDRGLVGSKVIRQPGRTQYTHYWLTDAGVAAAKALPAAAT